MSHARLSCVLAVVAWSGITLAAQTSRLMTADQLVEVALQRNRDFLAAKQRLAEARALLRRAGVRPAPTIEMEGATGRPIGTVGD